MITVTKTGLVTQITLDRPEKGNAINAAMSRDYQAAFQEFAASDQRVAVVTGRGDKFFSGGADVNDPMELWRMVPGIGFDTGKPIIAATSGWAMGAGFMLVLMADLCVAAESTKFGYPEARLGVIGGLVTTLASRIPHKVAMEMMLLGDNFGARRAYEVGFVNRVVPDGTQVKAAMQMAEQLAGYEPKVLASLKRTVTESIIPKSPSEIMWRNRVHLSEVNDATDPWKNARETHNAKRAGAR
jgi:enoyl-CoA hydratase